VAGLAGLAGRSAEQMIVATADTAVSALVRANRRDFPL
jgi:hypothetical protein